MDTEHTNVLSEFMQLLRETDAEYNQIAFDISGCTVRTWFEIDDSDGAIKRKIMLAEAGANARMIGMRSHARLLTMFSDVRDGEERPSPFAQANAQAATH